jgi:hypothetical protein
MPLVTIVTGLILAAVGPFYFFPEQRSLTALIPTAGGILFVVLGILALKPNLRKHAMHAASVLGLLGFAFPTARAFKGWMTYLEGGNVEHPAALAEQAIMAGICLVFTALCVSSFIRARRARAKEQPQA